MAKAAQLAVLCFSAACTWGCATIVHGTRQTVMVTSDPPGATVTVLTGRPGDAAVERSKPGVTPIALTLPRRDANLIIRLETPGCEPAEMPLKRSVSGWTFGNLAMANPLALQGMDSARASRYVPQLGVTAAMVATDFLTGGAYKLPKVVDVRLCASAARSPERF